MSSLYLVQVLKVLRKVFGAGITRKLVDGELEPLDEVVVSDSLNFKSAIEMSISISTIRYPVPTHYAMPND